MTDTKPVMELGCSLTLSQCSLHKFAHPHLKQEEVGPNQSEWLCPTEDTFRETPMLLPNFLPPCSNGFQFMGHLLGSERLTGCHFCSFWGELYTHQYLSTTAPEKELGRSWLFTGQIPALAEARSSPRAICLTPWYRLYWLRARLTFHSQYSPAP